MVFTKILCLLAAAASLGQAASAPFNLRVSNATKTPSLIGTFVDFNTDSEFTSIAFTNRGIPTTWEITAKGDLKAQGVRGTAIKGTPGGDGQIGFFFEDFYGQQDKFNCAKAIGGAFVCEIGKFTRFVSCTYNDGSLTQLFMSKQGKPIPHECQEVELRAFGRSRGAAKNNS